MLNKDWIELTDALIKKASEVQMNALNGDILVAKVPPPKKTAGGIHLAGTYSNRLSYFEGFGRIIQLPASGFASTEGEIPVPTTMKNGDFIVFTHTARYKPKPQFLNLFFEEEVEDEKEAEAVEQSDLSLSFHDIGYLFFVPFPDVKMVKDGQRLVEFVNASST